MTKYKQSFEKCVSKIQKTQDAYKFRREITEITSSIILTCEVMENKPLGSWTYELYEWYIFQQNTRVYITNVILNGFCTFLLILRSQLQKPTR